MPLPLNSPEACRGSRSNVELIIDASGEGADPETEEFLSAPTHSAGVVEIEQGTAVFGPQGIARRRLEWRDLEGDGRYLIDAQHPPTASGAGARQVREMIDIEIAQVVQVIDDERGQLR